MNLNMLPEFFRKPKDWRELLWQPNSGNNKPKMHWFQFSARDRGIFRINSKVFGICEFKYANKNFKEAKEVGNRMVGLPTDVGDLLELSWVPFNTTWHCHFGAETSKHYTCRFALVLTRKKTKKQK